MLNSYGFLQLFNKFVYMHHFKKGHSPLRKDRVTYQIISLFAHLLDMTMKRVSRNGNDLVFAQ